MATSSMRHPHYESARDRDRREAEEEIALFLDSQARRASAMTGRRILPAIAAHARPTEMGARP